MGSKHRAQVSQVKLATHNYPKEMCPPKESLFERFVWAEPSPNVTGEAHSYPKEMCPLKESLFERLVWAKPSPGVTGEACYTQLP